MLIVIIFKIEPKTFFDFLFFQNKTFLKRAINSDYTTIDAESH